MYKIQKKVGQRQLIVKEGGYRIQTLQGRAAGMAIKFALSNKRKQNCTKKRSSQATNMPGARLPKRPRSRRKSKTKTKKRVENSNRRAMYENKQSL